MSSAVLKKIRHTDQFELLQILFMVWRHGRSSPREVQYPRLMEVRQFVLAHNPGKAKKKQKLLS